jgi:hypothetical protein
MDQQQVQQIGQAAAQSIKGQVLGNLVSNIEALAAENAVLKAQVDEQAKEIKALKLGVREA